jgi:hypothetical protein
MAEKLTLTVTDDGSLLIGPGHAFGDEDVPMMVEAAGAVSDVLGRRAGKSSAPGAGSDKGGDTYGTGGRRGHG